jgi:hypothetical protein
VKFEARIKELVAGVSDLAVLVEPLLVVRRVLAQGLGDEDRQAPWDEKGNCRPGATVGRDYAPHLGQRHRVPLDPGASRGRNIKTVQHQF